MVRQTGSACRLRAPCAWRVMLQPHPLSAQPSQRGPSLTWLVLPVSLTPCASGLLCWVGLPFAFPRSPWGLLTRPGSRQQAAAPLGRSAPVTPLAALRLGQRAERPPSLSWDQRSECDGTRGRNAMGPEVGMGKIEVLAFTFFHSRARSS